MRALAWKVVISTLIFWVLMTFWETGGLSIEGFRQILPRALIFGVFYGLATAGWDYFKGTKQ
jgi:hypothetical protein